MKIMIDRTRLRAIDAMSATPHSSDLDNRFGDDDGNGPSGTIDELETAVHLLHAGMMACDRIEDLEERNGLVALLAEVEARVLRGISRLKLSQPVA